MSGPLPRIFSANLENAALRVMFDTQLPAAAEAGSLTPRLNKPLHSHSFCEVFAVGKGTVTVLTEDGELKLGAGDLLFLPPGVRHIRQWMEAEASCVSLGFLWDSGRRQNLEGCPLYRPFFTAAGPLKLTAAPELVREVYALYRMPSVPQGSWEGIAVVLRFATALLRIDRSRLELLTAAGAERREEPVGRDRTAQLEYILLTRFTEPLSMETLARELWISPRHLARLMQRRYGKNLHQVLTEYRMHLAGELLKTEELTVESIAAAVGISRKSTFYRAFREHYGMTPQAFRSCRAAAPAGEAGRAEEA